MFIHLFEHRWAEETKIYSLMIVQYLTAEFMPCYEYNYFIIMYFFLKVFLCSLDMPKI